VDESISPDVDNAKPEQQKTDEDWHRQRPSIVYFNLQKSNGTLLL